MTLDTSRKILKVVGILGIIFGVIALIFGVLAFIGSSMTSVDLELTPEQLKLVKITGIAAVVLALITLLEGIFSVRAANDFSKIMPAWIFAIISLVANVVDGVLSIARGGTDGSSMVSIVLSIALSCLVFVAANNNKKSVGK